MSNSFDRLWLVECHICEYDTLKTASSNDSMMPIINATDGLPLNANANPDWRLGYDHLPFSWFGFMWRFIRHAGRPCK